MYTSTISSVITAHIHLEALRLSGYELVHVHDHLATNC